MADIEIKARISADTSDATKGVDKLNNSLGATKKSTTDSVGSFGNLKKTLSDISPAAEGATKGAGMLNGALNMLRANPIIAVISLIVIILVSLFEKFRKMEGVSDSLGKAWGVLSGVFSKFINGILTPLIDGFTFLVDLFTNSVVSILDTLGITSKKTADEFGNLTEGLDDLEDTQRKNAIASAESNRLLQEAREIAADANVPIKERIKAIQDASRIEKEQLENVIQYNTKKTEYELKRIALELGARSELIAKIKEGTLAALKAAKTELEALPNIDKKKLESIDAQIIAAENAAAQKAQVGKKEIKQTDDLNKEQAAKDKEAADKRKAEREKEAAEQKRFLDYKNKLQNEANLAAITDEVALAKQKVLNSEKDKLKEVESLVTSENNKAQLRAMITKSSLNEIAKIEREARIKKAKAEQAEEEKALEEKKKKDADNLAKQIAANDKKAEALFKAEDERKKKLEEQKQLGIELLNPYDKEVAQLEEAYKKKLEIAKGNEALIAAVEKEFGEQKIALRAAHKQQELDIVGGMAGQLSGLLGKQTAAGKAAAVAGATIDTYSAAWKAFSNAQKNPISIIGPAYPYISAGLAVAGGLANIKNILSVPAPGGGGSTPTAGSVPTPITPQQQSTMLNSASIQGVGNAASAGAGRSFVLDTDIKDNQERQARINRAARLG